MGIVKSVAAMLLVFLIAAPGAEAGDKTQQAAGPACPLPGNQIPLHHITNSPHPANKTLKRAFFNGFVKVPGNPGKTWKDGRLRTIGTLIHGYDGPNLSSLLGSGWNEPFKLSNRGKVMTANKLRKIAKKWEENICAAGQCLERRNVAAQLKADQVGDANTQLRDLRDMKIKINWLADQIDAHPIKNLEIVLLD